MGTQLTLDHSPRFTKGQVMKTLIVCALIAASAAAAAQETRREVTLASKNAADDRRANSDAVPAVQSFDATIQRVVILRFKFDTDLLAGLQAAIREHKIRNAVILSGFGSVRSYQVHQVSNRDLPPKEFMVKNPSAPADIISMSGIVMNGRVHPHMTLANADRAFGGHLEPDTRVFTFAVITLGVLDDPLDLSRLDDWNDR